MRIHGIRYRIQRYPLQNGIVYLTGSIMEDFLKIIQARVTFFIVGIGSSHYQTINASPRICDLVIRLSKLLNQVKRGLKTQVLRRYKLQ